MRSFIVLTLVSSVCVSHSVLAQHSAKPKASHHVQQVVPSSPVPCKTVTPAPTPTVTPPSAPLTAAQLRADPVGTKGKTVQWTVRVYALETADPLRKGLANDEPYWLVSGPGTENAVMYIAIPPTLLSNARAFASIAPAAVNVVATVRTGRSDPAGVPILDAVSFTRQ